MPKVSTEITLTTAKADPTVSMKGLIQTRAQLCVIVLIYRTDQSLAAIPSIHSGHEDSAGTAGKGAAGLPGPFLPSFFPLKMPPSYTGSWGVPLQVQNFTIPFVELHEIPVDPFLQLVEVILDGSTIL
ncbi:hypothetical protein HGM15179_011032 [Zosterops borbonicus]|uniref:Uncharacterized protein n=1 Tax=Zosterops borbonicus TaxID=364589 RepID=A0A8K1GE59_9PASS|nr:hypothetical protein HGM15179_011032 [Zosterops borbonicus]